MIKVSKISDLNWLVSKVIVRNPNLFSDEKYLKAMYYLAFGEKLNLDNPKTYNEKMQWMKLYNRNPLYTQLVDKVEVKKYVDTLLGPGYTFPTLGCWDNPDEIDFDSLPNEYILKCNHNSGVGMAICKDNSKGLFTKAHGGDKIVISKQEVIEGLRKGLNQDFFVKGREWPYKNVKRRVFAEKLMKSDDGKPLKDYKIFCFDGEPKYIWVGSNYDPMWFDLYTSNWVNLHVKWGYNAGPETLPPPENLKSLLEVARKLAQNIPHVRIDLYSINGQIYFGEYTFFTWGGFGKLEPKEWDLKLGEQIELPSQKQ